MDIEVEFALKIVATELSKTVGRIWSATALAEG